MKTRQHYPKLLKNKLTGFAYCKIITDSNFDVDFSYLDVNDAFETLTALSKEDIIGKKVTEVFPDIKDLHPELFEIFGKVALTGEEYDFNIYFEPLKIWLNVFSYSFQQGYFIVVLKEITEPASTEEEQKVISEVLQLINESENWENLLATMLIRLKQWSNCQAVGIRIKQGEDFPYFVTSGFPAKFVQKENYLCTYNEEGDLKLSDSGKPILECMCGNVLCGNFDPSKNFFTTDGSFWSNSTTELLATTKDTELQNRTRNYCNSSGYESVALIPLRSGEETFGLLQFNDKRKNCFTPEHIALYRRIADNIANFLAKKKIEKELRESERKYRGVLDTLPALVCRLTPDDGSIKFVNNSFCEYFKKTKDDLLGKSFSDLIPEAYREEIWYKINKLTRENPIITHEHPVTTLGGTLWQKSTIQALLSENGKIVEYQLFGEDITLLKQAEEKQAFLEDQLRQSQKMEALGTLAGGIAHDFNNLLVPIIGLTKIVQSKSDPESKNTDYLRKVIDSAEKARDLVSQVLIFCRKADPNIESVQPKAATKETLKFIRSSIPPGISIKEEIDPNIYPIMADATQFHQIIVNLCINASYAMPYGGELTVGLRNVDRYKFINSKGMEEEGTFICLSIRDVGHGMEKHTLDRIFEPFFTTRENGEGTGLGLSVVLGIVKLHGGNIEVYSEVETSSSPGGTTFHVYLPAYDVAGETAQKKTQQIVSGSEKILFIDDNDIVIETGTAILEDLGYLVTSLTDPRKAIEMFSKNPQEFDLVITDYTMSHITGADLAEKIKEIRPEIPVILCTGYSDAVSEETIKKWNIDELIMKPFEWEKFSQIIRRLIK